MTRIEQKIAALERKLQHVGEPDGLIIFKPGPGEPEASIKRFYDKYPNFDYAIIVLPEKDTDED